MLSWQQVVPDLPTPLQSWLIKSYLTHPNNGVSALFLEKESYILLYRNLEYLSLIYPYCSKVHPEIRSLVLVYNTYLTDYVKSGVLSYYS